MTLSIAARCTRPGKRCCCSSSTTSCPAPQSARSTARPPRITPHAETARGVARGRLARGCGADRRDQGEIVAFNTLSWPRRDALRARPDDDAAATGAPTGTAPMRNAGRAVAPLTVAPVPAQIIGQRDGRPIVAASAACGTGYQRLMLRPATEISPTSLSVSASARQIENRFFRLELDDEGNIVRLLDKRQGARSCRRASPPTACSSSRTARSARRPGISTPPSRGASTLGAGDAARGHRERPGARRRARHAAAIAAALVEQDIMLYDRMPRIDFVTRGLARAPDHAQGRLPGGRPLDPRHLRGAVRRGRAAHASQHILGSGEVRGARPPLGGSLGGAATASAC